MCVWGERGSEPGQQKCHPPRTDVDHLLMSIPDMSLKKATVNQQVIKFDRDPPV